MVKRIIYSNTSFIFTKKMEMCEGKTLSKKKHKAMSLSEKIRRAVMILMAFIAVGSLGYFAYYNYQASHTEQEFSQLAELKDKDIVVNPDRFFTRPEEEAAPNILNDYKALYNKNKSLIGWLKIDDTNIDYPVMQSKNEEYYLEHDFDQNYDKNGTLFISADAKIWPRSQNIIVFGHNMKSGKMFGSLSQYKNSNYYEKHKQIQFDTLYEKGTYEVMYVFLSRVYDEAEVTFKYYQFIDAISEEEFNSHMEDMKNMSLYDTGVTAAFGDQLLTLSTCDHDTADAERFVVVAKRIQ